MVHYLSYPGLETELKSVIEHISIILKTEVTLLNNIYARLMAAKSKFIRPIFALLTAKLCLQDAQHPQVLENLKDPILYAAIIEIIHTATLLHDDVVDNADSRRHLSTAHLLFGNSAAILTGDFLYAKAFEAMVAQGNLQAMHCLAKATAQMAEGEARQLSVQNVLALKMSTYFKILSQKTASLFSATAQISGLLGQLSVAQQQSLKTSAEAFGMAFQLLDDLKDYRLAKQTSKKLGNDLQEGKLTLPLLHFLEKAPAKQRAVFKTHFREKNFQDYFNVLVAQLEDLGSIEYTATMAEKFMSEAIEALAIFKNSTPKENLVQFMTSCLKDSVVKSHKTFLL